MIFGLFLYKIVKIMRSTGIVSDSSSTEDLTPSETHGIHESWYREQLLKKCITAQLHRSWDCSQYQSPLYMNKVNSIESSRDICIMRCYNYLTFTQTMLLHDKFLTQQSGPHIRWAECESVQFISTISDPEGRSFRFWANILLEIKVAMSLKYGLLMHINNHETAISIS